jgi:hypothetical protein
MNKSFLVTFQSQFAKTCRVSRFEDPLLSQHITAAEHPAGPWQKVLQKLLQWQLEKACISALLQKIFKP